MPDRASPVLSCHRYQAPRVAVRLVALDEFDPDPLLAEMVAARPQTGRPGGESEPLMCPHSPPAPRAKRGRRYRQVMVRGELRVPADPGRECQVALGAPPTSTTEAALP